MFAVTVSEYVAANPQDRHLMSLGEAKQPFGSKGSPLPHIGPTEQNVYGPGVPTYFVPPPPDEGPGRPAIKAAEWYQKIKDKQVLRQNMKEDDRLPLHELFVYFYAGHKDVEDSQRLMFIEAKPDAPDPFQPKTLDPFEKSEAEKRADDELWAKQKANEVNHAKDEGNLQPAPVAQQPAKPAEPNPAPLNPHAALISGKIGDESL